MQEVYFGEIQSGHLEQVGYDTYCNLLEEVIKEMKGIPVQENNDVQMDLNVTSYIPDEYISDAGQKIDIYQKIALCKNEEDIQNVIDEMIDRFGNMPDELENLIDLVRIKTKCKENGIEKVVSKENKVIFTFQAKEFSYDITKLLAIYKNRIKFSPGVKSRITLTLNKANEKGILKETREFFNNLEKKA